MFVMRPHKFLKIHLGGLNQRPRACRREVESSVLGKSDGFNRWISSYGGSRNLSRTQTMKKSILLAFLVIALLSFATAQNATIRVGAFPNITHAQAMVGKANGCFDKAMGSNVKIHWKGLTPVLGDRGAFRRRHRHDVHRPESRRSADMSGRMAKHCG